MDRARPRFRAPCPLRARGDPVSVIGAAVGHRFGTSRTPKAPTVAASAGGRPQCALGRPGYPGSFQATLARTVMLALPNRAYLAPFVSPRPNQFAPLLPHLRRMGRPDIADQVPRPVGQARHGGNILARHQSDGLVGNRADLNGGVFRRLCLVAAIEKHRARRTVPRIAPDAYVRLCGESDDRTTIFPDCGRHCLSESAIRRRSPALPGAATHTAAPNADRDHRPQTAPLPVWSWEDGQTRQNER